MSLWLGKMLDKGRGVACRALPGDRRATGEGT